MTAAEFGNHTKEHNGNGLVVEERRSWIREAGSFTRLILHITSMSLQLL